MADADVDAVNPVGFLRGGDEGKRDTGRARSGGKAGMGPGGAAAAKPDEVVATGGTTHDSTGTPTGADTDDAAGTTGRGRSSGRDDHRLNSGVLGGCGGRDAAPARGPSRGSGGACNPSL